MELHPEAANDVAPANREPGVRDDLVPSSSSEDPPAKSSEELVDACSKKSTREERAALSTGERARPEVATERVGAHAAAESGRERLKRHRMEMAGRVWIPETWGQENRLKDWIDSSVFDRPLVPKGLVSAREALVEACRRTTSSRSRQIRNPC